MYRSSILTAFLLSVSTSCVVKTAETSAPVQTIEPDSPASVDSGGTTVRGPVICNGTDDMEIANQQIEGDEFALQVNGACDVRVVNSSLRANGWAIVINGSADVVIENSIVEGGTGAAKLNGSADLRATQTRFVGNLSTHGVAEFIDEGGNSFD